MTSVVLTLHEVRNRMRAREALARLTAVGAADRLERLQDRELALLAAALEMAALQLDLAAESVEGST